MNDSLGSSLIADSADKSNLIGWLQPSFRTFRAPAMEIPRPSAFADRAKVAVLDTGVLLDHPWIRDRLVPPALDATGLGPMDEHGHGTVVSLLLIAAAPDIELVSVRVLNREGRGSFPALLSGLEMALEAGCNLINVSLGRYDPDCLGDCVICNAVSNVAAAGVIVVAAAGNTPGQTDCPAKAGLFNDQAIAVSAWDPDTSTVAWYSGIGTVLAENAAERFNYQWSSIQATEL